MIKIKSSKYRTKKWNSLTELKDYLVRTKAEKIISFDGIALVTDSGSYGLAMGKLKFTEKKKKKANKLK